jgi:CheY-like chemotaxis protein
MGRRVLVVDDDKATLNSLRSILESEGFNVDTVETGEDALEKYRIHVYDLALIDLRLPAMDGDKLVEKMDRPGMAKIIITGAPKDRAQSAVNQGADGYLLKPFDPQDLLEHIKKDPDNPK